MVRQFLFVQVGVHGVQPKAVVLTFCVFLVLSLLLCLTLVLQCDVLCPFQFLSLRKAVCPIITPGWWQSKTNLTIDERGSKSIETVVSIAICRRSGDK